MGGGMTNVAGKVSASDTLGIAGARRQRPLTRALAAEILR
jgi:hypothetical protein